MASKPTMSAAICVCGHEQQDHRRDGVCMVVPTRPGFASQVCGCPRFALEKETTWRIGWDSWGKGYELEWMTVEGLDPDDPTTWEAV